MPSQSGEERLVPAPWWSVPLSSVMNIPFPVATSPEIEATSGVERQSGPCPGRYGVPLESVRQCVDATPFWYAPAASTVLLPPPVTSQAVSDSRFGGLPPSLLRSVPPTATANGLADG